MCHKFKQQNLKQRLLQLEFKEPCKLDYLRKEHKLALDKFIKNIEDSRFDCEYDANTIINEEQRKIEQHNAEERKKRTHNLEAYVDVKISDEFIYTMKKFQRTI